jgi:hypothetical protein
MHVLHHSGTVVIVTESCCFDELHPHIILIKATEGKGPVGRRRFRWVDNIEMHLKEIRFELDYSGSRWGERGYIMIVRVVARKEVECRAATQTLTSREELCFVRKDQAATQNAIILMTGEE